MIPATINTSLYSLITDSKVGGVALTEGSSTGSSMTIGVGFSLLKSGIDTLEILILSPRVGFVFIAKPAISLGLSFS